LWVLTLKKLFAALFIAILLLIPLVSGCGSENGTDAAAPANQDENTSIDPLDVLVEELVSDERAPGEVIVMLKEGITEEEAYQIFVAHGFDSESIEKQYAPQIYVLHFSEEERDIRSVIREFLLDSNVKSVSDNPIGRLCIISVLGTEMMHFARFL
jgi:hypothetical protein